MASTRSALREVAANVDESMGVRQVEFKPRLSPMAAERDIGRTPLRKFGKLRLDQIVTDPNQPRQQFEASEIRQLASSIRSAGQLHPIRVRWDENVHKWVIVTGERRYRATLDAGLEEIDCFFHEDDITESEVREQQLVENLLRQDLKPLEEARGYAALMELNCWNGKQVAEALGISASRVSRAMALLNLPPQVQQQIDAGELARTSAYELSKLDNATTQARLAEQSNAGLTHAQTSKAVRQRRGRKHASRGVRQVFNSENGIRVTVTASRKASYHEIEQALSEAMEEVRTRIDNRVQLF